VRGFAGEAAEAGVGVGGAERAVERDRQLREAADGERPFELAGGAVLIPESEVGRAPELIRSLLDDPRRLAQMSDAMLRLARPAAADEIAEELIALAA